MKWHNSGLRRPDIARSAESLVCSPAMLGSKQSGGMVRRQVCEAISAGAQSRLLQRNLPVLVPSPVKPEPIVD